MTPHNSNLKRVELVLLVVGLALIIVAVFINVAGSFYSQGALARFHSASASQMPSARSGPRGAAEVDYALWSSKRVDQYKASLAEHFDNPLAVLRVDKIHLEAPVFDGTSDRVLNRGLGRIDGTARIGHAGNIGIAGHRDGFFRGLKDVNIGDSIQLETVAGTQTYLIDSIRLVDPHDVSVLKGGASASITLVTCFPFYYVGSAPQRYIVHASLTGEVKNLNESVKASSQATASRSEENPQ